MSQIKDLSNIKLIWSDIKPKSSKNHSLKSQNSSKVNIKKGNESKENEVDEYLEHINQLKISDAAGITSSAAVGGAIGLYIADLAVEQVFLNTLAAELTYAAGVGAWGGAIGIGIGAASALTIAGIKYIQGKNKQSKFDKQKLANEKIKMFNEYLDKDKSYFSELNILKNELIKQEKQLNNVTFRIERFNKKYSKIVVVIGPTGYGKSTVCNRLLGDVDDICDIEDNKNPLFVVANSGDSNSCTNKIIKKTKKIKICFDNDLKNMKKLILSVVDTPGAFDSKGNDKHYQNQMQHFFQACGGVNVFCIFFKFGEKLNINYGKLLESYQKFWGSDFWKHAVIVITKCDMDSKNSRKRLTKGYNDTLLQIREFLKKQSNGKCDDNIPVYAFGEENFEDSVKELMILIKEKDTKYICDNIKSPMDVTWKKVEKLMTCCVDNRNKMVRLSKEIEKLKKEIDGL